MDSMAQASGRPNRSGDLAFIVVIIAAYVSTFSAVARLLTMLDIGVLIVAGVVYTLIGLHGMALCERLGTRSAAAIYFAIQLALGGAIVWLSRGGAWLLLLPLVGHAVVLLSRRWVMVVCLLLLAIMLAPLGLRGEWETVTRASFGYLAAIMFVVVFTQIAVSEGRARTEVERLAGELAEANRKLRDYALQVEELATVNERNRLAREIHDGLGHYLTVINVQVEAARALLEHDRPHALETLHKVQRLTQEALGEVRRSVTALRASPSAGRPLPEAIAALVDEARAAGIQTDLVVAGSPRLLAPPAELALYRAAQEGLTNVRKHARAARAALTLAYGDDGRVRLTVRDDGVGAAVTDGGFGLLGLTERIQILGGRLHTRTAEGQGFTLDVEVPG